MTEPKLLTGTLRNGKEFQYERFDVIGDHVVFFREPVGQCAVYPATDILDPLITTQKEIPRA